MRGIWTIGIILFTSVATFANAAFAAELNDRIDRMLGDAISQVQGMMVSMSQGCSGGANGVPPVNWGGLQPHGNAAVNAPVGELQALVNGAHDNCSGGARGVDPVNYGRYVSVRDTLTGRLQGLSDLLGN
jgi:hypothetical protein